MVSLYGILNIGARGVSAAQSGLDTTGHNIANVNTEGYTRQRVIQRTVEPLNLPNGSFGQGVEIISIERLRDQFLDTQIYGAQSNFSFHENMERIFSRLETILNDPLNRISDSGDPADATGINNVISRFFRAIHELSLSPESPEVRTSALESAQILTDTFNTTRDQMFFMLKDLNDQVGQYVKKINNMVQEIAAYNQKIATVEAQANVEANDFRDQRDHVIHSLSKLVPITTIENSNGIVSVSIGGQWIVNNFKTNPLKVEVIDTVENVSIYGVRLGDTGMDLMDDIIRKGELGAVFDARDRLMPLMMGKMDDLAAGIIREVNRIHSGASGLEGYGDISSSFVIPSGASSPTASKTLNDLFNRGSNANTVQNGAFNIRVADQDNDRLDTFEINVYTGDTLYEIAERIDRSDGIVRVARSALQFDPVFAKSATAGNGITASEQNASLSALGFLAGTPISETAGTYSFEIHLRDQSGGAVDSDPNTVAVEPFTITFNSTDTLADLANRIQSAGSNRIRANLVPSESNPNLLVLKIEPLRKGETLSLQNDTSGIIQAMNFPLTDPTLPLNGGDATSVKSSFSGSPADSFLGSGAPNFSPAFPGPPPSVIQPGTFEFVVIDNNNVPTVNTITLSGTGIDSMNELAQALQALDTNLSVVISADNQFTITSSNNRSFFFQNDQTGLIKALGFDQINGMGSLSGQPFQDGSFEIVVANASGTVMQIFEVPVKADPSVVNGVPTLQGIVNSINSAANTAGAPLRASIVADPTHPSKNILQIESADGYEFTFRSDDSLLLSALGFTAGPILDEKRKAPITGAEFPVAVGDQIGGLIRAQLDDTKGLTISSTQNQQFSFVGDSSHFLAAAGFNGLFRGSDARSMRVNEDIAANANLLATSSDGTIGNNQAANAIAALEDKGVINGMTPGEFYRSTIAVMGAEGEHVRQSMRTNQTILNQLNALQESNSGVSLDEESINIIKFQQAFQASARIISTVDRLLELVITQIGR